MASRRRTNGTPESRSHPTQEKGTRSKEEAGINSGTHNEGEGRTISDAFNAPVRPDGLNSRNSLQRRLSAISQYDLFWLAVGVFVVRIAWFFLTNGSPHAPTRGRSHMTK